MVPDEIVTERLILHEVSVKDFDAIHAYACDPEVIKYMEWGPNSPDDTRDFIAKAMAEQAAKPRKSWRLAIRTRLDNKGDGGKVIGSCRITIESDMRRQASIGCVLAREAWGKGYATEVVKGLINHGFTRLGMHRICATCHAENSQSANVLRKIGMRYEGRLRHEGYFHGQWHDTFLFALVNE